MHLEFRVKPINDKKDTYWTAPRVFHRPFFFFLVENFKTLFQFFLLLLIKRLNERYRGISVGRTESIQLGQQFFFTATFPAWADSTYLRL